METLPVPLQGEQGKRAFVPCCPPAGGGAPSQGKPEPSPWARSTVLARWELSNPLRYLQVESKLVPKVHACRPRGLAGEISRNPFGLQLGGEGNSGGYHTVLAGVW